MRNLRKKWALLLVLTMFFSMLPGLETLAEEENLVPNNGFEDVSNDWANGWGRYVLGDETYASIATDKVRSGKYSAKIHTTTGGTPWMNVGVTGFVPGALYEVSSWINAELPGLDQGFVYKLEFYSEAKISADYGCGEFFSTPYTKSTNGVWVQYAAQFVVPMEAKFASLYLRIMTGTGTVYVDDVCMKQVGEPEKFSFEIGDVFHYPHEEKGYASVALHPFFHGSSVEQEASADFELLDGDKVLARQENVRFYNMLAEFTYDISLLKEKQKAYVVKTTAKWKDEEKEFTQNVYVYDRPTMLSGDGIIRVNGEPFRTVMGYHIFNDEHFDKAAEIGVTAPQFGSGYATEEILKETEGRLERLDALGMKALYVLYRNGKPAAHPDNIDDSRTIVEHFKDDPRILAWAIMDEPFNQGTNQDMQLWMEESYKLVRDIDSMHPVNVTCISTMAMKYADIFTCDYYNKEDNRGLSAQLAYLYDHHKGEIHNHYLGDTYQWNGVMQTEKGIRGSIYRAFEAGAKGIGYYSISDAVGHDTTTTSPLFEHELWKALVPFSQNEVPVLFDIFVDNKYEMLNAYQGEDVREGDYWSTWTDGKTVYIIVHNKSVNKKPIEVPLKSRNGFVSVGSYEIELVGGPDAEPVGTDTLTFTLDAQSVSLYKLTAKNPIDLSRLDESTFNDLEGYDWAKDAIETLVAKNIANTIGENQYGPGKNITRADFAMFLIRTLGLSAENTENFADVAADAYYAKDVATGRALGILKGVDAQNFNPGAEISRQDMMTICARGIEVAEKMIADEVSALDGFSDKDAIRDYAVDAVRKLVSASIVVGDDTGKINPFGNTTRAEAAVIMERIMKLEAGGMAPVTPPAGEAVTEEITPEEAIFVNEPSEEELKNWAEAKAFLSNIGIIKGSFDVQGGVSRAEAAELLSKMKGNFGEASVSEKMFEDVPVGSVYAPYIHAMCQVGYMNGVGGSRFAPEKPVTYNQAVKILVSMLGYEPYAKNQGDYPAGYLTIASQIDLLNGTVQGGDEPIRAGVLAKLIRNALEIDLVQETVYGDGVGGKILVVENCTLLSEYFNIAKYKGRITANYYTSVAPGAVPGKTEVAMGDTLFEIGETNAADFVGQDVILYVKEGDEKTILDVSARGSVEVITIDGDNVSPRTTPSVIYYEAGGEREADVPISGATLVYNGKIKNDWTRDDLVNVNGIIKLICNSDRGADVILVDNFTTHVVEKVLPKEEKVFFKDGTSEILDDNAGALKVYLTDAEGNVVSADTLTEWMVLSLAKSEDEKLLRGIISKKSVEGTVSEISDEYVTINETEYRVSRAAAVTPVLNKPETFYLDFMDKIVAKNDETREVTYGYFVSIAKKKGVSDVTQLKIFTTEGEMKVFEAADRVEFNDEGLIDGTALLQKSVFWNGETPNGQLVIYSLNADSKVKAIRTAEDCQNASREEQLSKFSIDDRTTDSQGPFMYRGDARSSRLFGGIYQLGNDTIYFKVPENYSDNAKDYSVYDHTDIKHGDHLYHTDFYDIDENYVVSVIVQKAPPTVKGGDVFALITGFGTMLDADGIPQKCIYTLTANGEETLLPMADLKVYFGSRVLTVLADEPEVDIVGSTRSLKENITVDALKVGDIIRFSKADNGIVNGLDVLLRGETPLQTEFAGDRSTSKYDNYFKDVRLYGPVKALIDDGVVVEAKPGEPHTFKFTNIDGYLPIYCYNKGEGTFEELAPVEIMKDDMMFIFKSNLDTTFAVVYRD